MSQQISGVARSHRAAVGLRGVILAGLAVTIGTPIASARSGQATAPAAPETTAQAPAAPALTRDHIREFLSTAKIVRGKDIPTGVTHPVRLTLSDGTLTHDAAFSTVDEHRAIERFEGGRVELDFVDSYKYSLAAYKIAELVGLGDMMPVHVEREWHGHKGALSWWIDAKMTEAERLRTNVAVPQPAAWNDQMHRMRVFTQLVADTDRNAGNILIDADWKLWMIDFTRAFRRNKSLLKDKDLKRCDRLLLENLRGLTAERVAGATKPYLNNADIAALLARRDLIVTVIETLAAKNGAAQVLY
jgi:hypothetical protein